MRRTIAIVMIVLFLVCPLALADKKTDKKRLTQQQTNSINAILRNDFIRNAQVGISVVSLKDGEALYKKNANRMLIPASTNKVVSGAAALDTLGPHYRFTTGIYYDGRLENDGTLNGNLYIKGGADPSLCLEQTWLVAHKIRAHGIKKIKGNLIGDESFFDDARHYKQWGDVGTRAYHAPLGALSVNYNTFGVNVTPGPRNGAPGNAIVDPDNNYFNLVNHLLTTSDGRTRVAVSLRDKDCIVSGQIPLGAKNAIYYRSIEKPLPFALASFRAFMSQEGITIEGKSEKGTVPSKARLLFDHKSKPLSLIIRDLYRNSNNFTAEQTARTLGAVSQGVPGTQDKAAEAIVEWLKKKNLYDVGVVVVDASGLSRDNRLSPKVLVNVLKYMWNKPEAAPEFVDAMAIGGQDGTLKRRFLNTPLQKRVRAKSGLLWGVITLAGYCYDSENNPYAFSIMVNEYSPSAGVRDIQLMAEKMLNIMMK